MKTKLRTLLSGSRTNILIALAVVAIVVLAGVALLITNAAGFFAAAEPDNGTLTPNAKVVTDGTASGGKSIQFTAPAPAPTPPPNPPPTPPAPSVSCAGTAKPGPNNTGPSGNLTPISGMTITTSGTVLENVSINGGVVIKANNVTLRNFKIDAGNASYGINANNGNTGLLLERGEIYNVGSAHIYGADFSARCLNLHDSGSDAIKPVKNATVERTWMHHLGKTVGSHADATQSRWGGSNLVYRYNNCDIPVNQSGYNSNACFILEEDGGPINGVVIENNWLNGGNYTMYCENTPGVVIKNNRFGRNYRYGVSQGCPVNGNGNVWDDTGQPL